MEHNYISGKGIYVWFYIYGGSKNGKIQELCQVQQYS